MIGGKCSYVWAKPIHISGHLLDVQGNAAFLLREERLEHEVMQYHMRYMMFTEEQAQPMLVYLKAPFNTARILSYSAGKRLLQSWQGHSDQLIAFSRLLTQQLCPSELIWHRDNTNLCKQAIYTLLQACWMRADQTTNGLTISEEDQGGHALDAYLYGRLQILVGIHTGKTQLAVIGMAQFLEDRCQRAAGWAPGGREIDNHRQRCL